MRVLEWPQWGNYNTPFLPFDGFGSVEAITHLRIDVAEYSPKHLHLLYRLYRALLSRKQNYSVRVGITIFFISIHVT